MNERVVCDVVRPLLELGLVRQFTVQQEVCHLEVRALFGQLFDGVAAVAQDSGIAVEIRDRTLAGRGLHVGRVVDVERWIQLSYRRGREASSLDRNRYFLAAAVVADRHGVGHLARPLRVRRPVVRVVSCVRRLSPPRFEDNRRAWSTLSPGNGRRRRPSRSQRRIVVFAPGQVLALVEEG